METKEKRKNRLLIISTLLILVATLTPGDGKVAGNYLDKLAHFLLFLFFSISTCYTYQKNSPRMRILFWGILLGLFTEVFQQFIPGRNMDLYDAIADTLGVGMGFSLYERFSSKIDAILLKIGA